MEFAEVLGALGANRVIWIDDHFNESAELADMIFTNTDVARKSGFPGLSEQLERFLITQDESEIRQWIKDLGSDDEQKLKSELFQEEASVPHAQAKELLPEAVTAACSILNVLPDDQWSFRRAHDCLPAICEAGDDAVVYIIDLNEYAGSPTAGLVLLEKLAALNSQGTAFILTHEAKLGGEADKEQELRSALNDASAGGGFGLPVCVISKERLDGESGELEEALKISFKRAGLRRTVHAVLTHIGPVVEKGFNAAAELLLDVPPEQLENFAVQRAMDEGISELHFFERAIGAKISEQIRASFASGAELQTPTQRLRLLRSIELKPTETTAHANLAQFRALEVWESAELLNRALSPIESGDVFEIVPADCRNKGTAPKKFVLLGQPCDISIRGNGKRGTGTGYLVPLKVKDADAKTSAKEPLLPFQVNGVQWAANFRAACSVNLQILDLAALREDGAVRVDANQVKPSTLLPGVEAVFNERIRAAQRILSDSNYVMSADDAVACMLVFGSDESFKAIKLPSRIDGSAENPAGPVRLTWALRRIGRIRLVFASSLLRDFFAEMGRDAFDLDFAKALKAVA